jgi:hypothetical protein
VLETDLPSRLLKSKFGVFYSRVQVDRVGALTRFVTLTRAREIKRNLGHLDDTTLKPSLAALTQPVGLYARARGFSKFLILPTAPLQINHGRLADGRRFGALESSGLFEIRFSSVVIFFNPIPNGQGPPSRAAAIALQASEAGALPERINTQPLLTRLLVPI